MKCCLSNDADVERFEGFFVMCFTFLDRNQTISWEKRNVHDSSWLISWPARNMTKVQLLETIIKFNRTFLCKGLCWKLVFGLSFWGFDIGEFVVWNFSVWGDKIFNWMVEVLFNSERLDREWTLKIIWNWSFWEAFF